MIKYSKPGERKMQKIVYAGLIGLLLAWAGVVEGALLRGHDWEGGFFENHPKCTNDYLVEKFGKAVDFNDGQTGPLCGFEAVKGKTIKDGLLSFQTTDWTKLYIGNFLGYELEHSQYDLGFNGPGVIKIRMKQNKLESTWKLKINYWHRFSYQHVQYPHRFRVSMYKDKPDDTVNVTVKGTDWQVVEIALPKGMDNQLAFMESLALSTKDSGNDVQIDWIKLEHGFNEGCYRKVFELKADPVSGWLFVKQSGLSGQFVIYVNGQEVARSRRDRGEFRTIDCRQQLRKGSNVIAVRCRKSSLILNGDIVCGNGDYIKLNSDASWKVMGLAPAGWEKNEFNDTGWTAASVVRNPVPFFEQGDRAYQGALQVQIAGKPDEEEPFFRKEEGINIHVNVPIRQQGTPYEVRYAIVDPKIGTNLAAGSLDQGQKDGMWIKYVLSYRPAAMGVYRLKLDLIRDGEIIDKRDMEIVLVGRIDQPEVAGQSYEEGLDLKLVDAIECGKADDSHPFLDDGQSRIVQSVIGAYRETGLAPRKEKVKVGKSTQTENDTESWFSYILKVAHPQVPHLVVVTYPDDAERQTFIKMVANRPPASYGDKNIQYNQQTAGTGYTTGGAMLNTGRMKELKYIVCPPKNELSFDVVGKRSAVASVKLYEIANGLPAAKICNDNGRLMGIYTERSGIFMETFSGIGGDAYGKNTGEKNYYQSWYSGLEQFVRYMRFTGQNLYAACFFQYSEGNTSYETGLYGAKLDPAKDFRKLMAAMFAENQLYFIAGIQYSYDENIIYNNPSDIEMTAGAPGNRFVDANGKQCVGVYIGDGLNFIHPEVRRQMTALAADIARKYSQYKSFKGMTFAMSGIFCSFSARNKNPIEVGYDDYTVALFSKETDIEVPGKVPDSDRFSKRYHFLTEQARAKWLAWRADKICETIRQIAKAIQKERQDARLLLLVGMSDGRRSIVDQTINDVSLERVQMAGLDLVKLAHISGVQVGPSFPDYTTVFFKQDFMWDVNHGKYYRALMPDTEHFAVRQMGLCERPIFNSKPEWIWNEQYYTCTYPYPSDRYFLMNYALGLSLGNPSIFMEGHSDGVLQVSHEDERREIARAMRSLPPGNFQALSGNGLDKNVVIKSLFDQKATYFYVINPGWWQAQVTLDLADAGQTVQDLMYGEEIKLKTLGLTDVGRTIQNLIYGEKTKRKRGQKLVLDLKPFEIRTFSGPVGMRFLEAKVEVPKEVPQRLTEIVKKHQALAKRIAKQAYVKKALYLAKVEDMAQKLKDGIYADNGYPLNVSGVLLEAEHNLNLILASKEWQVIGPFANEKSAGLATVYPVETDVLTQGKADEQTEYEGMSGKKNKWRKVYTMDDGGHAGVNLDELFVPNDWVVAYAWIKVYSPVERPAVMWSGSDDGMKAWLNGEKVHEILKARSAVYGDDKVPVKLKQGWNSLLVKVEDQVGGWKFFLDFMDDKGELLTDLEYAL